jgi:aminoglycoside phosphotransferase
METLSQLTCDWLRAQLGVEFNIQKHAYSHQDDVYKIHTATQNFYLKIASSLEAERVNLLKTQPYLSVPTVISFGNVADKDHLLLSEVPGKNLVELVGHWEDAAIVKEFARAVKEFHSLNVAKLFPGQDTPGLIVLHGDMALPNIICTQPGSRSFIDLGQMSVGAIDVDLADSLWSLQRNMGQGYGELFLKEYGDVVMNEKIDAALKFKYVPSDEPT